MDTQMSLSPYMLPLALPHSLPYLHKLGSGASSKEKRVGGIAISETTTLAYSHVSLLLYEYVQASHRDHCTFSK